MQVQVFEKVNYFEKYLNKYMVVKSDALITIGHDLTMKISMGSQTVIFTTGHHQTGS